MFDRESEYVDIRKRFGWQTVMIYRLGIDPSTPLLSTDPKDKDRTKGGLLPSRQFFDFNEHFIELSNAEGMPRSLALMISFMAILLAWIYIYSIGVSLFRFNLNWKQWCLVGLWTLIVCFFLYGFWATVSPMLFTALRARYRFNRTTRKVYVLRPDKFGGNAVLDWDRAKGHVNWTSSGDWSRMELLKSAEARAQRLAAGRQEHSLVIYWPPLDENDPERKGEDVLWVGAKGAGQGLWDYICTFMDKGMDAVQPPAEHHWLRKGHSGASEHLEETVMHRQHQMDKAAGRQDGLSAGAAINYAANAPWAPLNSLAEMLCYWPTFPEEWNSECGQKRRESGIGPEKPLRWKVQGA